MKSESLGVKAPVKPSILKSEFIFSIIKKTIKAALYRLNYNFNRIKPNVSKQSRWIIAKITLNDAEFAVVTDSFQRLKCSVHFVRFLHDKIFYYARITCVGE